MKERVCIVLSLLLVAFVLLAEGDTRRSPYLDLECSIEVTAVGDAVCLGDTAVIDAIVDGAHGRIEYRWSPTEFLSDPFSASSYAYPDTSTWYFITVIDDSSCVAVDSCLVVVYALPEPYIPDITACLGDYVLLASERRFDSYLWSTGARSESIDIIVDSDSALYWLEVTLNDCTARDTAIIWGIDCCTLFASGHDTVVCQGDGVVLSIDLGGFEGDVSYLWSPTHWLDNPTVANPIATAESSIAYTATIIHSATCTDTASVNITVVPYPALSMDDRTVCRDSVVIIHAPSGFESYLWSDGSTNESISIFAVFDSSSFWVEVSNGTCSVRDSFTVYTEDCSDCILIATACADTVICEGTFAYLYADAGDSTNPSRYNDSAEFIWSPTIGLDDYTIRDPMASPSDDTEYMVVARLGDDCIDTGYVFVSVQLFPSPNMRDTTVCRDSVAVLSAGSGFDSYLWSTGDESEEIFILTDYDSLLYWVEVGILGCVTRDSFWVFTEDCIDIWCEISVEATAFTDTICIGDTTRLNAVVSGAFGNVRYEWSPDMNIDNVYSSQPLVFPSHSTSWQVRVVDDSGCVAYDTVNIVVVSCGDSCFAHPKPFTPNDDGINDICKFEYPQMSYDNGIVHIFTLDNRLVRSLANGDVGDRTPDGVILWDGRDERGSMMKKGAYLYIIKVNEDTVCRGVVYIAR